LLVMAPSSQELGPPANPGRFIMRGVSRCEALVVGVAKGS
jgi:hypothetical protein